MAINEIWTRGMSPEDSELFLAKLQNSKSVLIELHRILTARLREKDSREVQVEAYEDQSWAYKQADTIGAKRELRLLLKIIESVTGPQ